MDHSVLTPWHIALARCVLQHKPVGMTVRDYIGRLRRSLTVQGKPPASEYFDGIAYWKDLYRSSQFEIRELQNKVAGLFVAVESLQSLGKPAPKRKAQEDLQPKRRNTRRKLAAPAPELQQTDHMTSMEWEDLNDNAGRDITYHLYAARTACDSDDMNQNTVAAHLIAVTNGLQSTIDTWYHSLPLDPLPDNLTEGRPDDAVMPNELSAVVGSFQLLIRCFTLLASKTDPRTKCSLGSVIYCCSKLFGSLLQRITPSLTAIMTSPPAARAAASRRPSEKTPAGSQHMAILTQLFLALLATLEPAHQGSSPQPAQQQLLDAVTYLTIAAVGDAVYVLSFGHARPATIREEVALDARVRETPSERARVNAVELRCLWRMVRQVLAVAKAFQVARGAVDARGLARRTVAAGRASGGKLSLDVRKRLERTLVRCIWREDQGDEMEDVLERPVFKGRLPRLPRGYVLEDTESQYWFFGEMFSLIGWGMLKKRDDL